MILPLRVWKAWCLPAAVCGLCPWGFLTASGGAFFNLKVEINERLCSSMKDTLTSS